MAEPEQESELLDGSVSDCLAHHTDIVDTSHEQDDQDGMSEELLTQALVDANAFDASGIGYNVANEEGEVCDTVQEQDHACVVNGGLVVDNNVSQTHISSNGETILVHSSESTFTNTPEAMFSNGTDSVSLLTNGTTESEDLCVENSHTFDVGSLPDGHIISIPSDIIPGSVIVSQSNEEQFQQSVDEADATQLLQDEIHQMDPHYVHSGDGQILQHSAASQLIQGRTIMQPHTITVSAASGVTLTPEVLQNVIQQIQAQQLAQQQTEVVAAAQRKNIPTAVESAAAANTVSFTLVSPGQHHSNSPPLGSSQNPIRIIQQGNRYTPMQQLTQEQLQQIMQVVQQQHVNKNTQENGGAVIFNPQTNTRIMYRVIYPSELHKAQNGAGLTTYQVVKPTTSSQEQQTATPHQKRPYRKRKDAAVASGPGEDEDKEKNAADVPELSKEEKEERKKHRPRTRSGRVSKPPKHMVQDYKRIHVLDWDEDYDDSDGGYSDFKHSDGEGESKQDGEEEHSTSPEFFQALGAGRPKNHKCQTCDKSYIGQAGLARHYRLNPDHCINPTEHGSISSLHNGSIDGDDSKDASLPPDGSLSRMSDGVADVAKTNCHASSIENISEDSNTQDSLNSTGATSPVVRRGRGRGAFRGRWAHLKHNALIRRKNKLKELIKQCSDEDLMEVVLPRLVSSVSLWEYLMMKSENGGARPQVDVIYREFEALRQHVKQACAEYMQPLTLDELEDDNLQCKMIKVSDKSLAVCLNLETVTYRVKEMPPGDSGAFSSLHSRLSPAAPTPSLGPAASSMARQTCIKVENDETVIDRNVKRSANPNEMDESTAKRLKITNVLAPGRDMRTSSSYTASVANTFTAAASTAQYTESNVMVIKAEPTMSSALSSLPLVTSLQSAQAHGHSSTMSLPTSLLSSSLSSPQSVPAASKSTSLNIRSPYIHISCPTTKQQPVSSAVPAQRKHSPASSRTSKSHPVPVAISESAVMPDSKSHMLPYIVSSTSSSLAGHQHKITLATSDSHTLQTASFPMVLAVPGSQQPNSAASVLLTGPASSGPNVIVRQPAQTIQPHAHVILTNPSSSSRSQKTGVSTSSLFPSPSVSCNQTLAVSTNPRSLLGIVKPTEVRVSRQLFHETTTPPLSSSVVTNGHSSIKSGVASMDYHPGLQHFNSISTVVSTSCQLNASIGSATVSNSQLLKPAPINKTLMTPPSGQQFSASPSKTVINSHMSGVDDISVLTGMDLSGDELGPLNTSTDSLNGALSGCQHLADSLMTADMAANSSVSEAADDKDSLIDMAHIVNSDMQAFDGIGKASLGGSDGIPLVNGNCSSYIKSKDCNIISQASSLSSPCTSLALSETSDFIHISKPSKLVTPSSQDSTSIMQPAVYHMAVNGPDGSHGLKSDVAINSSVMMSDISSLPFPSQGTAQIIDSVNSQLGGISPILTSDELQENGISILSDQMSGSEAQESDCQNMDLGEVAISDSLTGEEDGQLLLSEGTNIYQTEDGTIIIQKANGNTYQLQGAQGLSLETVQALLSGTLDQFVGVDVAGEGIQTDMNLH